MGNSAIFKRNVKQKAFSDGDASALLPGKRNGINASSTIFIYLVLFVFLEPPFIAVLPSFSSLDTFIDIMRIAFFAFSVLLLFLKKQSFKKNAPFLFAIMILYLVQLFVTIIYLGNVKTMISSFATICGATIIFLYFFGKNAKNASQIVCNYVLFLCFGNIITQILYPGGLLVRDISYFQYATTSVYFLGNSNDVTPFALCCIFFCFVLSLLFKKRMYFPALVVPVLTVILSRSSTALVCVVFYIACLAISFLFLRKAKNKGRFGVFNVLLIGMLFLILLLMFSSHPTSLFAQVIEGLLHKDMTFTGRKEIWYLSLRYIGERPLFGWGLMNAEQLYASINASHQHNYYLHILFQGGVVSLIVFLGIINCCRKRIVNCRSSLLSLLTSFILLSFFISFITESYDDNLYLLPFYVVLSFIAIIPVREKTEVNV